MALPTKEKTWQYRHAAIPGTYYATANAQMFWNAKNAMVNFASNPWTVWGSCDSVNYSNGDGADRWGSYSNVVWGYGGASPFSWIVLKQPALGTNAAVLLAAYGTSGLYSYWTIVFFPTGPVTGGTTTTRPSAPNECGFERYGYLGPTDGTWNGYSHVMQSTDGEVTRIISCRSGYNCGFWSFEKPKNPIAGWSPAQVMWCCGSNSSVDTATYPQLNDASDRTFGRIAGSTVNMYMTSEGWGTSSIGEQVTFPDDDSSEWPLLPVYLACSTVGTRGVKGKLYDLWWGSTTVLTGDAYPSDGSKTFVQFSDLVVPWDGTVPFTT